MTDPKPYIPEDLAERPSYYTGHIVAVPSKGIEMGAFHGIEDGLACVMDIDNWGKANAVRVSVSELAEPCEEVKTGMRLAFVEQVWGPESPEMDQALEDFGGDND